MKPPPAVRNLSVEHLEQVTAEVMDQLSERLAQQAKEAGLNIDMDKVQTALTLTD